MAHHHHNIALVVLSVVIAIDPADQERIFERFERAEATHKTGAMGLGLYIVKQILKMHGGDIRVKSELNRGSEFIVTLPTNATAEVSA